MVTSLVKGLRVTEGVRHMGSDDDFIAETLRSLRALGASEEQCAAWLEKFHMHKLVQEESVKLIHENLDSTYPETRLVALGALIAHIRQLAAEHCESRFDAMRDEFRLAMLEQGSLREDLRDTLAKLWRRVRSLERAISSKAKGSKPK